MEYNIDDLIREWFSSDSDRALRAWSLLIDAVEQAPLIPAYDIDRWIEAHRQLPRTGRDDRVARRRESGLTQRQLRALELASAGLKVKEIAHAMGLNYETVRNHLSRARYKLGAKNTSHAVAIAMRKGLFP